MKTLPFVVCRRSLLPIALGLLLGPLSVVSGQELDKSYSFDFQSDPFEHGWYWDKATWEKKRGEPGTAEWARHEENPEHGCIVVSDGLWRSPKIGVEPLAFVRVSIRSKAASNGYWGLLSYDAEDVEIPASPYSQIPQSEGWIGNEAAVLIPEEAKYCRVLLWPRESPIHADDISVSPISREQALAIAEQTHGANPPVEPSYETAAETALPKTMNRLEGRAHLTILFLGDSVSNDAANSNFQLLLERQFPGCKIDLLNKVGSGTSADAFLENDRIGDMLEKHEPHLVVFGGISNTLQSIPSIRLLAERVQKREGTEFLACTGTMLMPRYWANYERSRDHRKPYRNALKSAGAKQGFGVCDLGRAWEDYARTCGKPVEYFRRDGHHANERGKQVFGHLFAAYFCDLGE